MSDEATRRYYRISSDGLHPCHLEQRRDELDTEQYYIRCRCHSDAWQIWQPGDPLYRCPVTGAVL